MKDIAAELGVSIVTVSSALRNKGRVSSGMRARILKRARELNYRTDLTARGLATGHTNLIGMIVPDLMHPFFAALAKFLSRNLRDKGYSLVISSSEDDPQLELDEVETFLARRVDALVLASSQQSKKSDVFRRINAVSVPYVLLDRPINGLRVPFVGSDNEAIGRLATEHLIERGYGRIAYIGAPISGVGNGRLRGYKFALRRHGLAVSRNLIEIVESADEHGEECGHLAMQRLLKMASPPDAVFCLNDIIASGALKCVLDAGLAVPDDVAIIGVSNLTGLSYWSSFQVQLSSVDQDVPRIANNTAKAIIQMLSSDAKAVPKRILIPLKLVTRDST
jgi:LacI family transcriptional regulator